HQPPSLSGVTSTAHPKGGSFFKAAISFSRTSLRSMSGTVRMPTRAQALSQMMLRASLRELAWMALMAIDGWRQFISQAGRPPAHKASALKTAGLAAEEIVVGGQGSDALLFVRRERADLVVDARQVDRSFVVGQAREDLGESHGGVGYGTSPHAAMHRLSQR